MNGTLLTTHLLTTSWLSKHADLQTFVPATDKTSKHAESAKRRQTGTMLNICVELHEHRTSANQEITTTVQNQQINEPTTKLGVKATTCKAKAKAKDKDLTFKAKAKDLIPKHKVGYQNKYNLPLCQNLIVHIF